MYPKKHLFYGVIFSLILLLIFPSIKFSGFLIILFSTIFIDTDHYLYYVYKKKSWNLKKAYKWYIDSIKKFNKLSEKQKKQVHTGNCFLHGIEVLIIVALLIPFSKIFLFILIGLIFHQILDFIDIYNQDINPCKVFSFIYSLIYTKHKKLVEDYKI